MKLKPMRGFVLVEMEPSKEMSDGGVFIPETLRDKTQCSARIGVVKSIGAWKTTDDGHAILPEFKLGDRVAFSQYSGKSLHGQSDKFKLLEVDKVLAVLAPV